MLSTPRGVRDFDPARAILVKKAIDATEEVFKRFGFYPLITPAMETKEVLTAKAYGEETVKELFEIAGENSALRYDLTVPMARYVAMNKDLPLPFKRYQIGSSWRKEEPQRMRYREFIQADVDIVGSTSVESDAETIAACALSIDEIGVEDYVILLNSRKLLNAILEIFNVPEEKSADAIRVIDKMQKISGDDLIAQLAEKGIDNKTGESILNFIRQDVNDDEKMAKLAENLPNAKEEIENLKKLVNLVRAYKIRGSIQIDLSLARGIAYYTGFVWEFILVKDGKRLPSVGSGGRYDNLIGIFSNKKTPATGSSIGIDRIFDVLGTESLVKTYAKAFVAYIGEENKDYACDVARELRYAGIYTDLNVADRNLSKQLQYASALNIKYAVIAGNEERGQNKVKLRDMLSGQEELLGLEEAIDKIKKDK